MFQFVASGSRLRLYLPKETCLITFLLAGKRELFLSRDKFAFKCRNSCVLTVGFIHPSPGISCPRAGRVLTAQGVINGDGEPYGDAALTFTRDLVLQREVKWQTLLNKVKLWFDTALHLSPLIHVSQVWSIKWYICETVQSFYIEKGI